MLIDYQMGRLEGQARADEERVWELRGQIVHLREATGRTEAAIKQGESDLLLASRHKAPCPCRAQ